MSKLLKNKTESVAKLVEQSDELNITGCEHENTANLEEADSKVSTDTMEKAFSLIEETFNLSGKNYRATSFKDTGKKITLGLTNDEYDMVVSILNPDYQGLV